MPPLWRILYPYPKGRPNRSNKYRVTRNSARCHNRKTLGNHRNPGCLCGDLPKGPATSWFPSASSIVARPVGPQRNLFPPLSPQQKKIDYRRCDLVGDCGHLGGGWSHVATERAQSLRDSRLLADVTPINLPFSGTTSSSSAFLFLKRRISRVTS